MIVAYDMSDLHEVVSDALSYMEQRIDKRFTVIFPSSLLAKIEEQVKKKKLPKSVYIRQLIEKDLQETSEK
jgi:predicted DNA binding CopG/RHH family protein